METILAKVCAPELVNLAQDAYTDRWSRLRDRMRNIPSFRNITKPSLVTCAALALGILFAMDQVWRQGFQVTSDGLAYVDIGDAYFRGDWHTAINSHWSPLYSWLLGAAFYLTRPHAGSEGIIVQIVNLLIFGLSFIAFRCFLGRMKSYRRSRTETCQHQTYNISYLPEWLLDAIGKHVKGEELGCHPQLYTKY